MHATASPPSLLAEHIDAGTEDYRRSHVVEGYGDHYHDMYQNGYFRYQWEYLERGLLTKVLQEEHSLGRRRLLDFACGTGRILKLSQSIFDDPVGVDVSESMLRIAKRECPDARLLQQDLTREPIEASFDLVTAFRFFNNAEDALRSSALDAIHAMLADEGRLVANIHVNSSSPVGLYYRAKNALYPKATTPRCLGKWAFTALLEDHGFSVRSVTYYSYLPRTGHYLPSIPRLCMPIVEKVCKKSPLARLGVASSFLVVAEKRT